MFIVCETGAAEAPAKALTIRYGNGHEKSDVVTTWQCSYYL
jgi:hypothetical protein